MKSQLHRTNDSRGLSPKIKEANFEKKHKQFKELRKKSQSALEKKILKRKTRIDPNKVIKYNSKNSVSSFLNNSTFHQSSEQFEIQEPRSNQRTASNL